MTDDCDYCDLMMDIMSEAEARGLKPERVASHMLSAAQAWFNVADAIPEADLAILEDWCQAQRTARIEKLRGLH